MKRRTRVNHHRPWHGRLSFWLRHLCFWLLVATAAYALWLDKQVAATFELRQWSLPARVYGRPLEIYVGASIDRSRMLRELDRLGYQRVGKPARQGHYSASSKRVEVWTRGFDFWDFPEPARTVRIEFARDRVAAIGERDNGRSIELMRLSPPEIGRINPRRFEDRRLVQFGELPQLLIATLVAVEDRRYFEHHGVDGAGLARAMLVNVRAGRLVQGGSTLTQQLVKNFYLSRERTFSRKITEMLMAISLELRYEKSHILETYANEVFLGQDGNRAIHGFGLAAEFYFRKPLSELGAAELATLVGMVKGPSAYDPRRKPDAAKERRDVVLAVMRDQGLLNESQYARARAQPIRLAVKGKNTLRANPAYMDLVQRQLLRDYSASDLKSAGLNIFTTLDMDLQHHAELAVAKTLSEIEQERGVAGLQVASVVVEPRSGEILALIGDRRAQYAGFNRALDMRRSVGSTIKPFVYAHALAQPSRFSLASMLDDQAVRWQGDNGEIWQPRNFDGLARGPVNLLDALVNSLNLATVDLGLQLGVENVAAYLKVLGLAEGVSNYPSIFLGAVELSPMQLAEQYTALANDGFQTPLRAIASVTDQHQQKLNRYSLNVRPVMEPATAALVRFALAQVVERGTARQLKQRFADALPLAGKTGTSDNNRDSWFAGFGANRLAVAWIGRDDNSPTGLTGSSGALKIWSAIMLGTDVEPINTELPDDLRMLSVDNRRAAVIPPGCNNARLIPLHRLSTLPELAQCYGEVEDDTGTPSESENVFERLRGWFD